MFDWSKPPEEMSFEELEESRLNSRLVDQMAKQLRCPWHEVADRIERLVGEVTATRAKISREADANKPDFKPREVA